MPDATVVGMVTRRGPRAETRTSHNRPLHTSGAHTCLVASTQACWVSAAFKTWVVAATLPQSRSIGRGNAAPTPHALTLSLLGLHILVVPRKRSSSRSHPQSEIQDMLSHRDHWACVRPTLLAGFIKIKVPASWLLDLSPIPISPTSMAPGRTPPSRHD